MDKIKLHWGVKVSSTVIGNGYGYRRHNESLYSAAEKVLEITPDAPDTLVILSPELYQPIPGKRNWLFTMFEGTNVPEHYQKPIEKADILIAPSTWAANVLRAHFEQPVHVIPHGVDPLFTRCLRSYPKDRPFRFLWVGAPNPRKGWEEVIHVWDKTDLRKRTDVELYIKTTRVNQLVTDGNVTVDGRNLDDSDLVALYHSAHCFILPTRGEGFGLCVGPETLIQTPEGVEPICELNKGDLVLTDSGHYSLVEAKISREANDILKIGIKGSPSVRVTPEHPFLSYTYPFTKKELKNAHYFNDKGKLDLEWIPAKDLKIGDLVAIPRVKDVGKLPLFIDLVSFSENVEFDDKFIWKKIGYSPKTKQLVKGFRHIPLTSDVLEFFGWYIAEGNSMGGRGIEFSLHHDEDHVADWLISVGKDNFGLEFTKKKYIDKKVISVWTSSCILSDWFSNQFGKGAYNKKIPTFLSNVPSKMGPLLKGYFLGDGHAWKDQGGYVVTTASVTLAWQLRNILTHYGVFSRLAYSPNNGGEYGTCWIISIGGYSGEILCDISGLTNRSKGKRKPHKDFVLMKDYLLVPIKSIEEDGKGKVFDIQVKDTHSFVGNGVVLHNTLAEAMATGLPCIATGYSGVTQFFDDRVGYTIKYQMGRGVATFLGDSSKEIVNVAYPDVADLYSKMCLVLKDYKNALIKGKLASERIKSSFTWEKSADKLVKLLQEYGG